MRERAGHAGRSAERDRWQRGKKLQREKRKVAGGVRCWAHAHDFLFRRLIKCKNCGYSLIGERQKGNVYYRCQQKDCPTTGVREDRVTATVEACLGKLQFSESENEYLLHAVEALKQTWVLERQQRTAALNMKVQQIADRLNRLTDAYLDQTLERGDFERRKADLLYERRALEDQIVTLNCNDGSVPETLRKFLELANDAYLLYRTTIPEKKRRLVKIVTSNFTLDQKTLDFSFNPPFFEVANRCNAHNGSPSKVAARTLDALLASLANKADLCAAITADLHESYVVAE
jgi:hypothetical protein